MATKKPADNEGSDNKSADDPRWLELHNAYWQGVQDTHEAAAEGIKGISCKYWNELESVRTDVQEKLTEAYQTYVRESSATDANANQNAGSSGTAGSWCAQQPAWERYRDAVREVCSTAAKRQQAAQEEAQRKAKESLDNYAAHQRARYADYVSATKEAWSRVDASALDPLLLARIGSMTACTAQHVAWLSSAVRSK